MPYERLSRDSSVYKILSGRLWATGEGLIYRIIKESGPVVEGNGAHWKILKLVSPLQTDSALGVIP